jgi:drug/metabolite transporter (DMT)-like permease
VIYGLVAALGWGLADFLGALASRRIGSLPAVVVGQGLSAVVITAILVGSGHDLSSLAGLWWIVVINGVVAMVAYAAHYHALELGPVSVVSPIGASYAVVGVVLAIVLLGERPSALALLGMACTVIGTVLVSTDMRALRAGLRERPAGLWWAVGSAISFGVAGFTLGVVSKDSGVWQVAMFGSRWAMIVAFVPVVAARRRDFSTLWAAATVGIVVALAAGAADILGVASFSAGTTAGYLSIVLAASAVFPLVAVALSHYALGERLVPNQYVGVGAVVGGLLLLGLGS